MKFNTANEFYKLLGYLTKSDNSTSLVWEHNEEQGAWGCEGRIQIYVDDFPQLGSLELTAGVGNIKYRLNCNDFIQYICTHYGFRYGSHQDATAIRAYIPNEYLADFDAGLYL